jgi:hypothetical protein
MDWERIEGFVGFGRRDAPVVFIGMEEDLQSADSLAADLAIRSTYQSPVMDLKEAQRNMAGTERLFDPDSAPPQPTWRVMADLMLRYEGLANPTCDDRRRYRAQRLGRSDGDALLTELLPYPHPKTEDWLYARFGRYATRDAYEAAIVPVRQRLLIAVLTEAARDLIVCYGKGHWQYYMNLFSGVNWHDDGPFRVGDWGLCRVVLTKHFRLPDFNTNEQLSRLAKVALGQWQKTTSMRISDAPKG